MTTFYATRTATRMPATTAPSGTVSARAASARTAAARIVTRPIPADLYRDGDRFVVSADLPGIDPASVDIAVDGRTLSIRAERPAPAGAGVSWVSRERQAGSFSRRFTLGESIDTDRIAARYDNGVLDVTLPVIEKTKPRSIRVEGLQAPAARSAVSDVTEQVSPEQPAEQVPTPKVEAEQAPTDQATDSH